MQNDKFLGVNRRQFLRSASAGVALFHILPGRVMAGVKTLSPNEKLNVAGIGIGGQGGGNIDAVAGEGCTNCGGVVVAKRGTVSLSHPIWPF